MSEPDGPDEREAERVAREVLAMPSSRGAAPPPIRELPGPGGAVQRQAKASDTPSLLPLSAPGRPLPTALRGFFEPRFGHDFRDVRVHADADAAASARAVGATAYTLGNDIVFAHGSFAPETDFGRRLLAHELVHVVQQRGPPVLQRLQRQTAAPADTDSGEAAPATEADTTEATADADAAAPATGHTCTPDSSVGLTSPLTVHFTISSSAIDPADRPRIDAFIRSWHAAGERDLVHVHGYASVDGPAASNLTLSCERAEALKRALTTSSPTSAVTPIPPGNVDVLMHGETSEFGTTLTSNRLALVTTTAVAAPAPPAPAAALCPAPPPTTAATCAARHSAYCAASACVPANAWLPCACRVSGDVCDAVDAFAGRGTQGLLLVACITTPFSPLSPPALRIAALKSRWLLATNACIFGHWRAAFEAVNDPTAPIPSGLTPEWAAAVTICRASGVGSTACCDAHVEAEQNAIDRCGPYDSRLFGKLPTDVPFAPVCSAIARRLAPGPPFTGDFGLVADRIAYGKRICC